MLLCPLGRVDRLITDAPPPPAVAAELKRQGVLVEVAAEEQPAAEV